LNSARKEHQQEIEEAGRKEEELKLELEQLQAEPKEPQVVMRTLVSEPAMKEQQKCDINEGDGQRMRTEDTSQIVEEREEIMLQMVLKATEMIMEALLEAQLCTRGEKWGKFLHAAACICRKLYNEAGSVTKAENRVEALYEQYLKAYDEEESVKEQENNHDPECGVLCDLKDEITWENVQKLLQDELQVLVESMETQMQAIESVQTESSVPQNIQIHSVQEVVKKRSQQACQAWCFGYQGRQAWAKLLGWQFRASLPAHFYQAVGTDIQQVNTALEEAQEGCEAAVKVSISLQQKVEALTEQLASSQTAQSLARDEASTNAAKTAAAEHQMQMIKEQNSSMILYVSKLRVAIVLVVQQAWLRSSLLSSALQTWQSLMSSVQSCSRTVLLSRTFFIWKRPYRSPLRVESSNHSHYRVAADLSNSANRSSTAAKKKGGVGQPVTRKSAFR